MHTYCNDCGATLGGCPLDDLPSWPRYTVDHEANAASVMLREGKSARTVQLGYGLNVDLDADGVVIGYEILNLHPAKPYTERWARITSEGMPTNIVDPEYKVDFDA